MSTVLEREQQLNEEREIIKELLLSKINNDGLKDVHVERLKKEEDINNSFIRDYFDNLGKQEAFEKGTKEYSFYDYFRKYLYSYETINEMISNQDLSKKENQDNYIDYLASLAMFLISCAVNKRLLEIIEWYYTAIGDTSHNKESFVDMVSNSGERLFVFRNELLGNELNLNFNRDILKISELRKTLILNLASSLRGDFAFSNVNMLPQDKEDEILVKNKKNSVSGLLLFQLLNISAYISSLKEYGITTEEFNPESILHKYFEIIKESLERIGYIEELSEAEKIFINAEILAERFDREKQSRY